MIRSIDETHTKRVIWLSLLLMLLLNGCSTRYVNQGEGESVESGLSPQVLYQVHDAFYQPSSPRCVAVLPLQGAVGPRKRDLIRRTIYAHLSPRGFRDVEIPRVDHLITLNGLDVTEASDRAVLGEMLNCDAMIIGEVSRDSSFYGVYSKVEAGAKLKMVRSRDDEILWESEHYAALQDGGIPLSPISLAAGLFDAARNMEEEQQLRVVDDLARRTMSTIPEVKMAFSEDERVDSLFTSIESRWDGDLDGWLQGIPEQSQEARLRDLISVRPLTDVQQEELYRRLTTLSGKARDYRGWGESRYQRGDYEGALELFTQATGVDDGDAESWFQQGRVLIHLGRLHDADQSLVQAIAHNPDSDSYYAALGYINSVRGDPARARAAYEMALKSNQENGFAWYNLAVSDYNAGHYRDATEQFFSAGKFYLKQGRVDRVEQVLLDLKDLQQQKRSRQAKEYVDTLQQDLDRWVNQQSEPTK